MEGCKVCEKSGEISLDPGDLGGEGICPDCFISICDAVTRFIALLKIMGETD